MSEFKAAEEFDKKLAEHRDGHYDRVRRQSEEGLKPDFQYTPLEPTVEELASLTARKVYRKKRIAMEISEGVFRAAEEYDKRCIEHKEEHQQRIKELMAGGMKISVTYTPPEPTEEELISLKAREDFPREQQRKQQQKIQQQKKELAIKTRANQKEFTKIFGAVILILIVIVITAVVFK